MRFEAALALLQAPADGSRLVDELNLVVLRDPSATAMGAETPIAASTADTPQPQQPLQAGELRYGDTSLVSCKSEMRLPLSRASLLRRMAMLRPSS